ncbi:MAG: phosphoglucosamine mutase [Actinobacteria bacterium]|nr:phosphoglucosamine mutase [Actinomycetota bacterium]
MPRRYFGTDGVRGVVGQSLTSDLVERLGRAAALWGQSSRVLVGRDTRASGPALEKAFVHGAQTASPKVVLGGVLPTPAVALLGKGGLGAVISASHNPAEYNGVKLFDRQGRKLSDSAEEEIEALLDAEGTGTGVVERDETAGERYLEYVLKHFGADLSGLRVALDCANGAYSDIAPGAFERLGARVVTVGASPDGTNINAGCGATDLSLLQRIVRAGDFDLGIAFDGDGDRMLALDAAGEIVDGDAILAILVLHLGVDLVAVTVMTNLGFHALMRERGIRVLTTDVGDRYVLEALRREGGVLGGEQSGHIVYLRHHVTGDGLAAALLLCAALRGRSLAEAATAMTHYPQVKENVPVATTALPTSVVQAAERLNAELDGRGRVLVRPSGTEPVVRILAEADALAKAQEACDTIATLVRRELG